MKEPGRFLLVFLDGLGLAPAREENPLASSPMPTLERWLGGTLTTERIGTGPGASLYPLDATLDVEGLPQSATGQTTLFTGVNAAEAVGRHVPALPGPRLGELIERYSLFRQARRAGREVTFANAYTERYLQLLEGGSRRASATTMAVRAAGLSLRTEVELERGEAVTWDITGEDFALRAETTVPVVSAEEAGRRLGALASSHHLTVFESFLPDLVGHRRLDLDAAAVLARVDGLLGGLEESLAAGVTLALTSDHGNLEDSRTRSHTRNPVPLLARGPAARAFARASSLADVTPILVELMGSDGEALGRRPG